LPWLFAFILIVIIIETRRLKKKEANGDLPPKNNL